MSHYCPSCKRVLYNRRLKSCGVCGAAIPEELRFSSEEIAALDREMAEMETSRKLRDQERKEEAEKAAAEARNSWFGLM